LKRLLIHFPFCALLLLAFSGCSNLDTVVYDPLTTPEAFLEEQHSMEISLAGVSFVWSQPSSTIIVYFVGLFTLYAGYRFLSGSNSQRSKNYWGAGLLLTGLGALFAGTSYQAFGYEIKCSGREYCTWTSWWEIFYMLLSVPGMNALLIASANTNTKARLRQGIMIYAIINTLGYTTLLLYGAFAAVKWAVSFECLVLVSAPSVLFLIVLHTLAFTKNKDPKNYYLRNTWLILVAVGVAYGVYLSLGLTQLLWQHRIWFTENDVLHLGMIYWVYYGLKHLPGIMKDRQ
jgi:hypothetical protein